MMGRSFKGEIFFIIFLLSILGPLTSYAQLTTVGKEFWFGFMENNGFQPDSPDRGVIIITASEAASGIISYAGNTVNFNIAQGQQFVYQVNNFDILHRTSGIVENKGVYINSSGNVSVYAFNERFRSADGTVILPLSTLGKDYYITSHFEVMTTQVGYNANTNNESTLLVVAVENNTKIEITPSVFTLSGNTPNDPFNITLNSGQSYQIKARGDLTGTRVRVVGDNVDDCKNIAVFGGNKWVSVGDCGPANDHLFQQAYPVNTWGTEFFHVPLMGRTSGELVKVLASEDNTTVTVNGVVTNVINTAGNFITIDFARDEVAGIVTDKPASVTVFAKSQACNDQSLPQFDNGDPFMITYSPNQQLLKTITFNALQLPSITNHYVNIILKAASAGKTSLDGNTIGNQFNAIPGFPDFAYARIPINQGVHKLENPDGFIAYVYGFGYIESYGFAVGASLDNLNFEVEPEYEFDVLGEKVACLNAEAIWEINPENEIFTYFVWNFGDGSDPKIGKEVAHTFTQTGTYEVKITASISENSCDQQEEIVFEVEVLELEGEIKGPNSVCPMVEEFTYEFISPHALLKTDWKVEGGEIINQDDLQVTVRWGESNPNAKLIGVPYTLEGCPGKEFVLDVSINQVIESLIPEGEVKICFDPEAIWEYKVSNITSNRYYEWFVEGGEMISGGEEGVVQIRWNQPVLSGKVWFKEFSKLDNLCAGESPKLDISVNGLFAASVSVNEDVICFGDDTGKIELSVTGGEAPYTFIWDHAPSINAHKFENLTAGNYGVTVRDAFGCEIRLEEILVKQPELLKLISTNTSPTSCFGKADGEATIRLNGGVPPFSIDLPNAIINGHEIRLSALEGISYLAIIQDANGCELPVDFKIDSPLPVNVDVRMEKPSCPGESNGTLIAEPTGGFGPYIYAWDYDNSNTVTLTEIPKGIYQVSIQDNRGCVSIGTGEVIEEGPKVRMPTGFKPTEGLYEGVSNCQLSYQLIVYSRWGELIYSGSTGWDGTLNGEEVPAGTYNYNFQYRFLLNDELKEKEIRGSFLLIK